MFTFKKLIPVGRYRSFDLDRTDIKLTRKCVGDITEVRSPANDSERYKISFFVTDANSHSGFKRITLKAKFATEAECRKFVTDNFYTITNKYDLHKLD